MQSSPGADFVLQLLTSVRPAMLAHSAGGAGGAAGAARQPTDGDGKTPLDWALRGSGKDHNSAVEALQEAIEAARRKKQEL